MPDASASITDTTTSTAAARRSIGFPHVVAGMHLGGMTPIPHVEEFDSVLTVGREPGIVEDGLRHKHLHLPYGPEADYRIVSETTQWVRSQVMVDRRVLVRSERGLQRPALIIGMVILFLGGTRADALRCLFKAHPSALTDFRYRKHLEDMEKTLREISEERMPIRRPE